MRPELKKYWLRGRLILLMVRLPTDIMTECQPTNVSLSSPLHQSDHFLI